jgi:hypothetical protein
MTGNPGAKAMKKWTRPVFEEFDVNGEVTAYAGAERTEALSQLSGAAVNSMARQGAISSGAAGKNLAGGMVRCSIQ